MVLIEEVELTDFQKLQLSWQALEVGKDMTIFQQFKWYEWLNYHYKTENVKNLFCKRLYITAKIEEQIVMIAPIQINSLGYVYKEGGG